MHPQQHPLSGLRNLTNRNLTMARQQSALGCECISVTLGWRLQPFYSLTVIGKRHDLAFNALAQPWLAACLQQNARVSELHCTSKGHSIRQHHCSSKEGLPSRRQSQRGDLQLIPAPFEFCMAVWNCSLWTVARLIEVGEAISSNAKTFRNAASQQYV